MEGRETKAKQALGVISLLRHKSVPAGRAARISRDSAESIALGSASPAASLAELLGTLASEPPKCGVGTRIEYTRDS